MSPIINPTKLRKSFVLHEARNLFEENIWPVLDKVGEGRIDWLIEQDLSLAERLDGLVDVSQAKRYKWASELITDKDFEFLLPPWFIQTVRKHKERGQDWLLREINLLRSAFEQ